MAVLTDKNETQIQLTCDCYCGEGVAFNFEFWEDFPEEVVVSIVGNDFTHEHISKFGRRMRRAWNGLTGKDKHLTEFCVSRKELQEFMAHVNDYLYGKLEPKDINYDQFKCSNCDSLEVFKPGNKQIFCSNCGAHIDDSVWRTNV